MNTSMLTVLKPNGDKHALGDAAYIERGCSSAGACKASGQDAQQWLVKGIMRKGCCAEQEVSRLQLNRNSIYAITLRV